MIMRKLSPLIFVLSLLTMITGCRTANDIDAVSTDFTNVSLSLDDPLLSDQVQAKIKSNELIYISKNDILRMQDEILKGNTLNESDQVAIRVILYRFYSQLKAEGNKLASTAKSGAEIGISEDVFQLYNEDIEKMNKEAGDSENQNKIFESRLENYLKQLKGE